MALIRSGATSDELTVDPTSKAARVTLYDSTGTKLFHEGADRYILRIPRMTGGTPAAGSTILAFRNLGAKKVRIRKIGICSSFAGTAAATTQSYQLARFATATPTGGTALTVVKKRSSAAATTVTDARFGGATQTALTVTGVVFETPFAHVLCPRQNGYAMWADFDFINKEEAFEIDVNEGFAIQIELVAVAGDSISGFIEWDEFT